MLVATAVAAIATAIAATTIATTMATAAATTMFGVQLLFGRIAYNLYYAFVVQVFACEGVIEVYCYAIIFYHEHNAIYYSAFGCAHGDLCTGIHTFVYLALLVFKYTTVEFHHVIL